MITAAQIQQIAPNCRAPIAVAANLNIAFTQYKITSVVETRMIIAQACVESAEFNSSVENLNYSAEGLMRVWPSRFPTMAIASQYARQPEKIANFVYANRMGNGPPESGDGWRHRGRGWLQTTGKTNQEQALKDLGLPLDRPELLSEFRWAAFSLCHFWVDKNCAEVADDIVACTKRINGGTTGLNDRRHYWERTKQVIV